MARGMIFCRFAMGTFRACLSAPLKGELSAAKGG